MSAGPSTDRWFHDKDGNLVLFQFPNPPIAVWLVARLLEVIVHGGWMSRLLDAVGFGALFTWAWLELFHGSARVRRVLGGVVLVAMIVGRARG